MTTIQNIIVPTDFSEPSRAALSWAAALAKLDGAALHLVHALRFPLVAARYDVYVPTNVWEEVRRSVDEKLAALRTELESAGVAQVTAVASTSTDPVHAIEGEVGRRHADLVVMGTHGHGGIKHAVLGSVTERAIRKAPCPILAVKGDPQDAARPIRRILVPVDFSGHSDEAASLAAALARKTGASLELVHVIDFAPEYAAHLPPEALEIEQKMRAAGAERLEALASSLSEAGAKAALHLLRDAPAAAILAEAQRLDADLIVMGTHGHSGLPHLVLGSVTERTLRLAPCPVLAVKGSERDDA